MDGSLGTKSEQTGENMRVGVSSEEEQLENQHARRPYSRATAKPRQNVLAHDRLDLEEQECTEKNRARNYRNSKAADVGLGGELVRGGLRIHRGPCSDEHADTLRWLETVPLRTRCAPRCTGR